MVGFSYIIAIYFLFLVRPLSIKKVHTLPYYVHTTMYNKINRNFMWVLVRFYTQICFHANQSVRVSDYGHPVMYARQFCTNKPGQKIYRWILIRSPQNHTLLHNHTIFHMKKLFAPAYHPCKIYRCMIAHSIRHHTLLHNSIILHMKTFFTPACTCTRKYRSLQNTIQKQTQVVTFSFFLL